MTKADELVLEFVKLNAQENNTEERKKFVEKLYDETEFLCFPVAYHRFKDGSLLKVEEKQYWMDEPNMKVIVFNDGNTEKT